MPLIKSKSKQAFEHNMKAEMEAGKPQDQSLAIAFDMKRRAPKRKKMAEGGVLDSIVDTVKKSLQDPPAPDKSKPGYNARSLNAKKTADFQKGFGYAEGGMIDENHQPKEEAQDEHHSSIAAAIMAKKARQMKLDSDSDDDEMLMMAEGGQVDLDHNSMEEPNSFYELNEHAALKENYDEDMEDMHQPMDSNEHADEREANSENKLDMISAIRRKMASRRQF